MSTESVQDSPVCVARDINHVCIAVRDIVETLRFYETAFGVGPAEVESVEDQAVLAAIVTMGSSQLEFIQPMNTESGVAKFIERRGEGLHHICFDVDDLQTTLDRLDAAGMELIDKTPRKGVAGMIAFIHPKATRGVLVELVERGDSEE